MYKEILTLAFIGSCFASLYDIKRLSKASKVCIFLFLVILVTCRPSEMADYEMYVSFYQTGSDHFEWLYQLSVNILNRIGLDFIFFFLLMAILTIGIKWVAINRMSKWPLMALCIWISDVLIYQDMITIRAALASSFLFAMIYYKINGNKIGMWVSFALAFCSHLSALIFILLPFLSPLKAHRGTYITLLAASLFFPSLDISLLDIMPSLFTGYDQLMEFYLNDKNVNPYNLVVLCRWLICISLWWRYKQAAEKDKYFLISLKAYSIGCIVFFLFWKQMSVSIRMGELFWPTEILIMPYLMFFMGKRNIELGKLIPLLAAVVLFIINITMTDYWNPLSYEGI